MPKYTMSDKRVFTDYHSSCELNKLIQQKYELQNSHEYRLFLQKNAEKIMKEFSPEWFSVCVCVCERERERERK